MANVGDVRKLLEGKSDDQEVQINIVNPTFQIVIMDAAETGENVQAAGEVASEAAVAESESAEAENVAAPVEEVKAE